MVATITTANPQSNSLNEVLSEFLTIKGVIAAAIIGRDGFVIEGTSTTAVDMDALGAMVATAIGTTESLGAEFSLGLMEQYLAEFERGKVIMATVKDDILAIVTDQTAVIGGVRYAIRKHLNEVIEAM